jgi:hypothetical protein
MDCFLLPFIFSIRAAISFLLLFQQLLPETISFPASLLNQVFQWLLFLIRLFFTTRLGRILWSFLLMVLCTVFIVPIVFHSFYKSVYNFWPKHRKRSFWEIMTQPVPGIEFEGRLGKSADLDSLQRRQFNHKPIACRLLQNKILSSKMVTKSMTVIVHDCPMMNIDCDAPHPYGYQTYTTSNDASFIGIYLDQSPHTMLFFAISYFSCPDLVFKNLPHRPPYGFIMKGFAISIISMIFGIITLRAWLQLIVLSLKQFLQQQLLREMGIFYTKNRLIDQCNQVVSSFGNLAAYATVDADIHDDTMLSFDTDSSFWVCDNAASGHICKDNLLFSGPLVPSTYIVSTANGCDSPTLMGNVNLNLRDNDGMQHEFCLTEVNYMPNSPVNLLFL